MCRCTKMFFVQLLVFLSPTVLGLQDHSQDVVQSLIEPSYFTPKSIIPKEDKPVHAPPIVSLVLRKRSKPADAPALKNEFSIDVIHSLLEPSSFSISNTTHEVPQTINVTSAHAQNVSIASATIRHPENISIRNATAEHLKNVSIARPTNENVINAAITKLISQHRKNVSTTVNSTVEKLLTPTHERFIEVPTVTLRKKPFYNFREQYEKRHSHRTFSSVERSTDTFSTDDAQSVHAPVLSLRSSRKRTKGHHHSHPHTFRVIEQRNNSAPLVDGQIDFVHHKAKHWWHYLLIWLGMALLLIFAAIFAGLTIGLLGLDVISLEIIAQGSPDQKKRKYAKRILPVRKKGNLLLTTLILGNVLCNVTLSILIADVADGLIGSIASTLIIFIFAEILPQSACHNNALWIGARFVWFCWISIFLFYIICKPIAMFMDCVIGEDVGTVHTRQELTQMLQMYIEKGALDEMTANLMTGALKNRDRHVHYFKHASYTQIELSEVMTPMAKVYMLDTNHRLDFKTITEIFRSGKSRIPVYRKDVNNVIGLLLTKDLIFNDPEDALTVSEFVRIFGRGFLTFKAGDTVGEAFNRFKESKSHLAMIQIAEEESSELIGLVTFEDILEEFIQDEILDENDDVERIELGMTADRSFDYNRLKLLDPGAGAQPLTDQEIDIVVMNLLSRVAFEKFALPNGNMMDTLTIRWMLRQAKVVKQNRKTKPGHPRIEDEDYLFRRGIPTDKCIVILGGKCIVISGRGKFRLEAGTFSVLGAEVFSAVGAYKPDFSAVLGTQDVRYVILPCTLFQRVLDGEAPTSFSSIEPLSPMVGVRTNVFQRAKTFAAKSKSTKHPPIKKHNT